MLYSLYCKDLQVKIDSLGAVFNSISKGNIEYLWQGDPKYSIYKDYNIFPYVGRLTDETYYYNGKEYHLPIHGFANTSEFKVAAKTESSVILFIENNEKTESCYPFSFKYSIEYSLSENSVKKKSSVVNKGIQPMFFGIGSHPGFNVPFNHEGIFEDWFLEFCEACTPVRIGFDASTRRLSDIDEEYSLLYGKTIPLRHDLFHQDAIVLHGASKSVRLMSANSSHSITVTCPDTDFLGLWHKPNSDSPYICIEPWSSLPSHSAYIEDISKQKHIISLTPGETYSYSMTIELT